MNKRAVGSMGIALTLLLLVIFASACSGNDSIEVTFDGDKCVLSGPSDLETGAHLITVINSSEFQGWMRICRGDKGYVWQDILDFDFRDDADMDTELEWPPWCQGFPSSSVVRADSNQVVYEYKLRHEGQYFVVWEQNEPDAVWPCAPLTVQKAVVQNNPDDDSFLLDKEENFDLNDEYLRRSGSLSDGGR
jgi:hypothetical protein